MRLFKWKGIRKQKIYIKIEEKAKKCRILY